MRARSLTDARDGATTFVVVLDVGEEALSTLSAFAKKQGLAASHFVGLGAFSDVVVGFFDWQRKDYERIVIREQVEVLSLVGDITLADGTPRVHAHVVVGKRDGTAHGGHLIEGHVRPTLEITLVETPAHLRRVHDPATGIALIDPGR
ncbi:MAG: PPC domain-containing DNA-binding protein [Gemmatimonadaceae bacterium]